MESKKGSKRRYDKWLRYTIAAPLLLLVVLLSLNNPVNATLGSPSSATLSILDDDDLAVDATLFLPIVFRSCPSPNSIEILPNVEYWFLADDPLDWYQFDLFTSGNVAIELTNFVPNVGQLAVYAGGATCSSLTLISLTGISGTTAILNMGRLPAGRYFIVIATDGPLSSTEYYRLIVHAEY